MSNDGHLAKNEPGNRRYSEFVSDNTAFAYVKRKSKIIHRFDRAFPTSGSGTVWAGDEECIDPFPE
jgi:hypothetical protein